MLWKISLQRWRRCWIWKVKNQTILLAGLQGWLRVSSRQKSFWLLQSVEHKTLDTWVSIARCKTRRVHRTRTWTWRCWVRCAIRYSSGKWWNILFWSFIYECWLLDVNLSIRNQGNKSNKRTNGWNIWLWKWTFLWVLISIISLHLGELWREKTQLWNVLSWTLTYEGRPLDSR